MFEVDAVYLILLAEGFALLLLILLGWLFIALVKSRQKARDLAQLALRIKHRAAERTAQSKAFLEAVYHLEGDALQVATDAIERSEFEFFRQLIESLERGGAKRITTLDQALDRVIDSYKTLPPRDAAEDPMMQQLDSLRGENERLRESLSVAKTKVSDMLTEFGNMFGGGSDHELAINEILEELAQHKAENDTVADADAAQK